MRIVVFSIVDDWDIGPLFATSNHEILAWFRPTWPTETRRGRILANLIAFLKTILSRTVPPGKVPPRYDVRPWLREHGIPMLDCPNANDPAFIERLREMRLDLIVVAIYPQIFKAPLLALPRFGVINYHPSLLPRNAGAQPAFWVLRDGETKTGVTVHRMTERIDAGDILMQDVVAIEPNENLGMLMQRLHHRAASLIVDTVDATESGLLQPRQQNTQERTYNKKKGPTAHVIDWTQSSLAIVNLLRAVQPFDPLTTCFGDKRLLVFGATAAACPRAGQPGEVLERRGRHLVVRTGDGCVEITQWELEPFHGWVNAVLQWLTPRVGTRLVPSQEPASSNN